LSVGRLVPKKGFDVLIDACGILRRRGITFELRIVGGGELRVELLDRARRAGILPYVEFCGNRSQEQVADELADAEVFALAPIVMPDGDRDGIPNVLLEAMAAGVPVVASAVSGIPEIIEDGSTGRLVPSRRPDLLADVLGELLSDPAQRDRLAAAGRRFAMHECQWDRAVAPLRELLAAAIGASGPPAVTVPEPIASR
jgi:glycosyltransferase involved in cell wall biosynthesis